MPAAPHHQQYVYADSEDSLQPKLICAVCHDVCGTHSACPGCNQTFCEVCVHKWFNVQRTTGSQCTCPYCRRKLRFSDLQHDPTLQQQLDDLRVLCSNAPCGCPTVLPRADLQGHLQHSCPFEAVTCRFCGLQGQRASTQQHESRDCSKRPVPCSNAAAGCAALVPSDALAQHLELNCAYTCKPCPQCGGQVPRCDWFSHLQHACPAKQYCPVRIYGCSFEGDAAAVAAHTSSCAFQQHKQAQLAANSTPQSSSAAGAGAGGAAGAGGGLIDPGELPPGCVPDVLAAFQAATAHSCDCQVRQVLLNSIPPAAVPAKLKLHQQQQGLQQPHAAKALLQQLAADTVGPTQLATMTQPKVFTARHAHSSTHDTNSSSSSGEQQPTQPAAAGGDAGSSSTPSQPPGCVACVPRLGPVDALALGAPGCFTAVGLQSDVWLESAWRIMLNLAAFKVLKVQEKAVDQEMSSFLLYSSICRSWATLQDFCRSLPETGAAGQQQPEQPQQQRQQQQQQQQQQGQQAAAGTSSVTGAWPDPVGMLASLNALFSGMSNRTAPQQPSATTQQQQQDSQQPRNSHPQQQQQQPQQLSGRQMWQHWLSRTPETDEQQQQQDRRRSHGSSSSTDSDDHQSWESLARDGIPGLQRALYDDEYSPLKAWLFRDDVGAEMLSAVAAVIFPVCLWLSVGGPYFAPAEGASLTQLAQMASSTMAHTMEKLIMHAVRQQQRLQRKRRQEQQDAEGDAAAAAHRSTRGGTGSGGRGGAAGSSAAPPQRDGAAPAGVRGLGLAGLLPDRSSRDRSSSGTAQQQQQQEGEDAVQQQLLQETLDAMHQLLAAHTAAQTRQEFDSRMWRLATCISRLQAHNMPFNLQAVLCTPGMPYADAHVLLQQAAAGGAVREGKGPPTWLRGFQPLVVAEVASALLLLHNIRADQCEVSLIPGTNAHLQVAFRAYWALSVLAGADAWLGPGFRLSWQAVAALNDMLSTVAELVCRALGDSFYDPGEGRVPLSPSMALEAARLVLPPGLVTAASPHLVRLSASYRDASCEDLDYVTWEQMARKLGVVIELDKMVSLVNDRLPVTFMDEDEDEDEEEDEETEYEDTDSTSYYEESTSGEDDDDTYMSDDDDHRGDGDTDDDDDDGASGEDLPMLESDTTESTPHSEQAPLRGPSTLFASALQRNAHQHGRGGGATAAARRRAAVREASANGSSSGDWESADEEEAAALEQELRLAGGKDSTSAGAAAAPAAAGGAATSPSGVRVAGGSSRQATGTPSSPAAATSPPAAAAATASPTSTTDSKQHPPGQQLQELPQVNADAALPSATEPAAATSSAPGCGSSGTTSQQGPSTTTAEAQSSAAPLVGWRQQWGQTLRQMSKSAAAGATGGTRAATAAVEGVGSVAVAAAGAAAAAPTPVGGGDAAGTASSAAGGASSHAAAGHTEPRSSQDWQQQQQQALDNPYVAQLLHQACEVALQEPERLMLEGSLSPRNCQPLSTGSAAAAGGSAASASAAEQLSASELYLRVGTRDAAAGLPGQGQQDTVEAAPAAQQDSTTSTTSTSGAVGPPARTEAGARAGLVGRAEAMETAGRGSQQRQQRLQDAMDRTDACTHGVVLLVGLLEVVLQRMLRAAAAAAAADPDVLAAPAESAAEAAAPDTATATAGGSGGRTLPAGSVLLGSGVGGQVLVSAKHVQLGVCEDQELAELLLHRRISSAVGWAAAAPTLDRRLLPDASKEPLTAFLLQLAEGDWLQQLWQDHQQQQQLHQGGGNSQQSSTSCCVVYPADLKIYCGTTVTAPPAATPSSSTSAAATEAAAAAADGGGSCVECVGPEATCCFLSGWQCSVCADQTAAMASAGFEAQMQACEQGLCHVQQLTAQLQQPGSDSSSIEARLLLTDSQLQQLLQATRLSHLQQPYWHAAAADSNATCSRSGSNSASTGQRQRGQQPDQQGPELQEPADQAQLHCMQAMLQPLRDVVALREICLQQQQPSSVLPQQYFEQLVQDALSNAVRQRRHDEAQRDEVQQQLRSLMGPSSTTRAAAVSSTPGSRHTHDIVVGAAAAADTVLADAGAAAAGVDAGVDVGSEEEDCGLSIQPDALQLLQQAAEDFLVQQLAGANRLALHAGRQEVGPEDLRLAVQTLGYGRMLPQESRASIGNAASGSGIGGSSSKRRRVFGRA